MANSGETAGTGYISGENASKPLAGDYDVVIVGAGLLGCFAAYNLARYRLRVAVVDMGMDVCTGISKSNTSIVYSGAYSKPDTLKTELSARANRGFDQLCSSLGVRFKRCGSLMACTGSNGLETLERFLENGRQSGVEGLRIIDGREARNLEPGLSNNVQWALSDPNMGTVIPWELCIAAAKCAWKNGVHFMLGTRVSGISPDGSSSGYAISVEPSAQVGQSIREAIGAPQAQTILHARMVINCAGLFADKVYEMVCDPSVRLVPQKGIYRVLDTKAAGSLRHVILHEPEDHGKGLTLVPTIGGNILIGPTEEPSSGPWDTATTLEGIAWLDEQVEHIFPSLPMQHVIRSFAATRPNPFWVQRDAATGAIATSKKSINSFVILEPPEAPGFLSLIGIKTPGLTCANELGLLLSEKTVAFLGDVEENSAADLTADPPHRISSLPIEERNKLIRTDRAYGRIVCRCRSVSEGEVIEALSENPHPVTIDGIKRRTDAGMGRCQGSFCGQRVAELIAEHYGIGVEDVDKDVSGSHMITASGRQIAGRAEDSEAVGAACSCPPSEVDLAIVGGGAAGCAAAMAASQAGTASVLIIDRAPILGGILNQCVHSGFGSLVYGEDMAGTEFAERLVGQLSDASGNLHACLDTTVLSIEPAASAVDSSTSVAYPDAITFDSSTAVPGFSTPSSQADTAAQGAILTLSSPRFGVVRLHARGVILASGSRERPIGTLPVAGARPAGIYAAGAVQKMLNLGGYSVGSQVVILGSGDVGLIVARQLALAGCQVVAVVEQADRCTGLEFNRRRCLDSFDIPLLLQTTVVGVQGTPRITGVTLRDLQSGEERHLECDALITSIGLVPERDLLEGFGAELPPWLAVCGNADSAYSIVDMLVEDAADTGKRMAAMLGGSDRIARKFCR